MRRTRLLFRGIGAGRPGWTAARGLVAATLALVAAGNAFALINPDFTPVNLVKGAHTILLLKLGPADEMGVATAEVKRVIKGDRQAGEKLSFDVTTCPKEGYVEALRELFATLGDEPVLLFLGKDQREEETAFLNVSAQWFRLAGGEGGKFQLDVPDEKMKGTWSGSTDMLVRCVDHILDDPSARVPVAVGAEWDEAKPAGKVEGKIGDLQAVDVDGKGNVCLFVASDAGDRLLACEGEKKEFADVTERYGLRSKSGAAVWGDFNGDGLLDLASSDGPAVFLRQPDGKLGPPAGAAPGALKGDCVGLAALDVGAGATAGLLVTTTEGLYLLTLGAEGAFVTKALGQEKAAGAAADLGAPGRSLVADFDGDRIADILQLYAKGSRLYRGEGAGRWAEGVPCDVCLGRERATAALGDYDGDGNLDVLCAAEDRPRIWHNAGGGKFVEVLELCGSLAYMGKPGSVACGTCDINNDGRQDLYLAYADRAPQIFFNRGFRCFGFAIQLCANFRNALEEAVDGQQTGLVADLDGDGRQDLALALPDGEIWVLPRSRDGESLYVEVALPLKGARTGPVSVTGRRDKQYFGAWNVTAGGTKAFFGMAGAGTCRLGWQLPGGEPQEKLVEVEDAPVKVTLP